MNHAAAESNTPVSVITGFLGSGKTTLLNALLRHPRMAETAVLVNEFGEIGIDHLLFETLDDDVLLLAAGCLCCTIREDMLASLRSLFERRAGGQVPGFRRVVIETTGLADPAPILHTLLAGDSAPAPWVVDGIVTTVDAVNGNRQLSAYPESVKQAAVADRLLVTKTDVAEPHELTFHPLERLNAWPDSDRRSRLVVIVKDLDVSRIEREFRDLVTSDAAR